MGLVHIPTPDELREILHASNPKQAFGVDTKRQVAQLLSGNFYDQAVKRKNVLGITIDGIDTLDADDAIWGERGTKGYKVDVTITDISEAFGFLSPIDLEALIRAVSIYRNPGEIPMIPEHLSHDRFSLNGKRRHISLTVSFDVDFSGNIHPHPPCESLLEHRGKMTHTQAVHYLSSRDYVHHEQLAILTEVSQLINRNQGADIGLSGMSEEFSMNPRQIVQPHMKIHRMIATLMVTANRIIAHLLSTEAFGVYRQHLSVEERAFYSPNLGPHAGLSIERGGYTHFTSPLRRYADLLLHRILKAKLRNEPIPFQIGHVQVLLDYVNQRVFEIDTLLQIKRNQEAGKRSIEKIQHRKGRNPKSHELKAQIRRTAVEAYLLPDEVRDCILDDMRDPESMNWQWAVGIILLSNDRLLKESLREEVLVQRRIAPLAFLNSLAQTRLVLGSGTIFKFEDDITSSVATATLVLPDGNTLSATRPLKKKSSANYIRGNARRDLMYKVFRYYVK